jgi:hypothetical protein
MALRTPYLPYIGDDAEDRLDLAGVDPVRSGVAAIVDNLD